MPGPPPKRSAERRRRNKDAVETTTVDLDQALSGEVEIPTPPTHVDEETGEITHLWHPIAEEWYLSLAKSGQAIFYEASDWSTAYLLAESLSRDLKPQPIGVHEETGEIKWAAIPLKGASLNAYLKGMSALMTTEGERRRMRIELERKKQRDAAGGDDGVIPITQERRNRFKKAE